MSAVRRQQVLEYFTGTPAFRYYNGNDTTRIPEDDPRFDPRTMGNHSRRRPHRPSHAPSARWV